LVKHKERPRGVLIPPSTPSQKITWDIVATLGGDTSTSNDTARQMDFAAPGVYLWEFVDMEGHNAFIQVFLPAAGPANIRYNVDLGAGASQWAHVNDAGYSGQLDYDSGDVAWVADVDSATGTIRVQLVQTPHE
jgi:hypothetical protein